MMCLTKGQSVPAGRHRRAGRSRNSLQACTCCACVIDCDRRSNHINAEQNCWAACKGAGGLQRLMPTCGRVYDSIDLHTPTQKCRVFVKEVAIDAYPTKNHETVPTAQSNKFFSRMFLLFFTRI